MKAYISHRIKEAAKIIAIGAQVETSTTRTRVLTLEDGESVTVDWEWLAKHQPNLGEYFIRYQDDGYESCCPGDVFDRNHREWKQLIDATDIEVAAAISLVHLLGEDHE